MLQELKAKYEAANKSHTSKFVGRPDMGIGTQGVGRESHKSSGVFRQAASKKPKNTMKPENKTTQAEVVGNDDLLGIWRLITDYQPKEGAAIACVAEHRDGGNMMWAGVVTEVSNHGLVHMETRGETTQNFILTMDTLWTILPSPPNSL